MNRFLVGSVLGSFTIVVLGMGVLMAIDTEHAQLYLGGIGLLAVLGTVLTFGALLHITGGGETDRDRRETYARVMIALVTATAGTVGGVGGGAVVSSNQTDAAKQDAADANAKADETQQQLDKVENAQPQDEQPAGK